LLPALARFVEALREEGIAVSQAETLDAARALAAVGVEDRARVRAALRASLAKTRRNGERFDRVFERHFAPPARAPREKKGKRAGPDPGTGGSRRSGSDGAPRGTRRETAERKGKEGRKGRLRTVLLAERGRSERGPTPYHGTDPLRKDLRGSMSVEEERALAALVPKFLETLRRARSRRFRRASAGRLWPRRIFRENVAQGGVPFVLPRRRLRDRPDRVVLLVDVSWSVARAAGLFLWMAGSVLESNRRTRVVVFVDRPVDATAALRGWLRRRGEAAAGPVPRGRRRPGEGIVRFGLSFAGWLDALRGLDLSAPSDYGRALHALLGSHLRPSGRDTTLVVLGDARSNRFEPLPWTLEEIGRRCRSVLWLVPEPAGRWGTGDSAIEAYLPHVDVVVEAADLDGLARGVAELVRRS
jgi:uncharacterized protein with von Willebrand factor type A (vWA) domain